MKKKKRTKRKLKTGYHTSAKGGTFRYRSGWELRYATFLDNDPDVITYRFEPFPIPYVSNKRSGKVRMYWPDIVVQRSNGTQTLIEIKPAKRLKNAIVQKKIAAAIQFCSENNMTFQIITENDLKSIEREVL